jgi:MinD superfamily P-loop ATPase
MNSKPTELVVISGKGGTGKTSIVASFAALANKLVLADCDVDAADLHLVLEPTIVQREIFSGGKRALIDSSKCTACGRCAELCRFEAIRFEEPDDGRADKAFRVDPIACEGCGVCAWFCPEGAIDFSSAVNGEWYVSDTRHGPMVHAKLGIAEENSGKLVSTVRKEAGAIAQERGLGLVLIDGSPGIGCPVVASITGADLVLIVTEPTLSGLHDLGRVADVARHFGISAMVCINKWDLNPDVAGEIERQAKGRGLGVAGRVRYDRAVTEAQIRRQSVVEYQPDGCAEDVRRAWGRVNELLAAKAAG